MKCLMIMEPISPIIALENTSFGIMLEAKKRGFTVSVCDIHDFSMEETQVYVKASTVEALRDQVSDYATLGEKTRTLVSGFDVVFMRAEPPVNEQYVHVTQLLELSKVRVVNRASSLRDFNEKLCTLMFPELCPETLVTADNEALQAFVDKHHTIVCKPLDSFGGTAIFYVRESDVNRTVIFETLTREGKVMIVAQRFIPDILTEGDKRIILICGEPIPFALVRKPAARDFRGNLSRGGSSTIAPLTAHERTVSAQLAPFLREKGLFFVGIDMIGGLITEINITATGCARDIAKDSGVDVCKLFLDAIE